MKIAVLPGDGIGPEVTAEAVKVLKGRHRQRRRWSSIEAPIGRRGVDAAAIRCPQRRSTSRRRPSDPVRRVRNAGRRSDPVHDAAGRRLLRLRKSLGLFANFRPAFLFPELIDASTLKRESSRAWT
jgi:3-isopropylmalate dehydrogenase